METVRLDGLDGFGFERLCARIVEGAGWGRAEPIGGVADGGRDVMVHRPDGTTLVVECKHQPGSSVGRPVVQKLHSAVISSGAAGGAILSTGKYTREAVEHAGLLSQKTPIELYDRPRLADLAQKAGIRLVEGGEEASVFCFPAPGAEETRRRVARMVAGARSHPAAAADLCRTEVVSLGLEPLYVVRANVRQDFSTSVGLIHSVDRRGAAVMLDARSGSVVGAKEAAFLAGSALITPSEVPDMGCPVSRGDFALDHTTLEGRARGALIAAHTATVTYRGNNNQTYSKVCRPGPRSVEVLDAKPVLLPRYSVRVGILKSSYDCPLIQNDNGVMADAPWLGRCGVCREAAGKGVLLCNACGAFAHPPKRLGSHSHVCARCGMTLCRGCTYWERRFLFFKRMLCGGCAGARGKGRKRKLEK